ncbi:branched-chain amino acid ABC transporter permease [Pusillimonas sp. ANT_WB101]|uniref:branched-chain amino acid ABC transporter permease n=1 Tax=Pusillimonas sp. ANT_WB101 TaxID=2597356 RepID=UPI0011EF824F|nr:branched-chain amino acid ABC transporter permease [Pusillimonas sp. ANT_WB101]KAA0890853.1 branched-chain amino acid ABC transporter permease [Pusillimonas sp. ANT_WB101]NYT75672.1 branched-chain amino acid ABC transporter permease [Alcaligenaceae bacterium]
MLGVLVIGLAIGSLYAAAALAYNVMYSTSKVLSITTGHIFMVSSVAGAFLIGDLGLPKVVGLLGAIAVAIVFGILTELIAIRRILARSQEHLWLLSTLALATIVQQAVGLWWGTEPRAFPRLLEQDYTAGVWDQKYWLVIGSVVLVALALDCFYRYTLFGKVFLAVAEDPFAARARGIATDRIRAFSYGIAGLLGGLVGFAAGQLTFAYFAVGLTLTLYGFIALAAGGLGSNLGAIVGGLALGLLSTFATYFFGGEYQQTIAVGLLMAFLLIKPEGLFGSKQVRHV